MKRNNSRNLFKWPLSLRQNVQFCMCVVRHHEVRQRTTMSERTTNEEL